ncbi:NTF2-related export protein 2 isoform X3 [Motacilla alba alba]|uniref:NTF2-related export protein 2 isoform X3 n=1 Tax=Motacilla alba alba TaxID=1094192 RepID=UPI0018D56DC6|nr:NTF2-related export protein 2 isoform X3 [Motacilla alba alba]
MLLQVRLPHISEAMLEGEEPLPVLYPLPQHFPPLVIHSSFCPLAYVPAEDTVQAVGRAQGRSVTALEPSRVPALGSGAASTAGQGRVLAADAVPGAFSLLIKASLPKKLKRNQDPLQASLDLHQT